MMPERLFLVRHGESEANIRQDLEPGDPRIALMAEVPDNEVRLSEKGEEQAKETGKWLREYISTLGLTRDLVGFNSTFTRAMETAGHLGLGIVWNPHAFIVERNWGSFEELTIEQQARAKAAKKRNPLYAPMPGGQNLNTLLISNYLFFQKLHREHSEDTVIGVCHGERNWTMRYMLERMSDARFGELMRSKHEGDRMNNCQVLEYTRKDPETGATATNFGWMRSFCPWKLREKDLVWKKIVRTRFTDAELLEYVGKHPRFLTA